jgi:UDP-N-acetylglucosamine 3-dehydrogenase
MEKINLGVVSYAHPHASRYAAAIAASPLADLVGIAGLGVNADLAEEAAERYGVPHYADFRDLLARDDLAGVYVGTEPIRHLEVVTEAAARGKHVLCDKPIALTLEEADEIIRLAQEASVKLMVPFNPRFQLPLMKVQEALESGEAGELISIFAIKYGKLPTKIPGPADYGWLIDPKQAGGGGFLDIGIHAVDALRWLAGSEARRVYADVSTAIYEGLPVDDIGTMTVEFENGVVGW